MLKTYFQPRFPLGLQILNSLACIVPRTLSSMQANIAVEKCYDTEKMLMSMLLRNTILLSLTLLFCSVLLDSFVIGYDGYAGLFHRANHIAECVYRSMEFVVSRI